MTSLGLSKIASVTTTISLLNPKSVITTSFGAPDSITSFASDYYSQVITIYHYGANQILVGERNKVNAFVLNDNNLNLRYNGIDIKVGDNISILSSLFPISYANKFPNAITVGIMAWNNTIVDESFLEIEYNSTTHLITKIEKKGF